MRDARSPAVQEKAETNRHVNLEQRVSLDIFCKLGGLLTHLSRTVFRFSSHHDSKKIREIQSFFLIVSTVF